MSTEHLLAELARIDLLIRREVLRWQLAGQDPNDDFRGLRISDEDATALIERPFGSSWGQGIVLDSEEEKSFTANMAKADRRISTLVARNRTTGKPSRLEHLAKAFNLTRFDIDVLLIALAPALDNRYERLYAYLQDDVTRRRPTINLALDLLSEPGAKRLTLMSHFSDDAPLFRYRLVERVVESNTTRPSLITQTILPDDSVVAWLLGRYQPSAVIASHTNLILPSASDTDELLSASVWNALQLIVDEPANGELPLVVFHGLDDAGQMASARRLASHLKRLMLHVDLAGVVDSETPAQRAVNAALRDAHMIGAIPFITGWDTSLHDGAPSSGVLSALCNFDDLVIVSGHTKWQARGLPRQRPIMWLDFGVPDFQQRRDLWEHFLDTITIAPETLDGLAGQFLLSPDQIRDAVSTARDLAALRGDSGQMSSDDLFAAARAHSNPNLAGLARKITPRYKWIDIILPEDQVTILHEVVNMVRGRPKVLDEWGVGSKLAASAGITILFAGSPGTGKTMAAEVIASELGLDLYKIDLSTIVSKYIGETEKNLERIFNEAQSSNAILFFDEADAIFGKRSEVKDAHDRYANIEVSYLLQRMEQYDGVTILATNLRANLDDAFTRRLQFALDFPFPDEKHRELIWTTLFPPAVPRATDVDFMLLARRFKLPGGNIRNIIVSAAYLAATDGGKVTMDHLLHGARREMQKMGRLLKETAI